MRMEDCNIFRGLEYLVDVVQGNHCSSSHSNIRNQILSMGSCNILGPLESVEGSQSHRMTNNYHFEHSRIGWKGKGASSTFLNLEYLAYEVQDSHYNNCRSSRENQSQSMGSYSI